MKGGTWIKNEDGTRSAGRWVRKDGKKVLERVEDKKPKAKPKAKE